MTALSQISRAARVLVPLLAAVACVSIARPSHADEGGASLYLPGSFASMAAVPGAPGWSASLSYYHASAAEGTASERSDLAYGTVTYAFATPVLGGQLSLTLAGAVGAMSVAIADTRTDSRWGVNDLVPAAAIRWTAGVNNYMVYTLTNVPSGTYNASRLANFGLGHWGQDAGVGYTYFDKDTGYEFSAVAGLTYNFENPTTRYQNGIDAHVDFAASKFLTDQIQLGVVGYVYQQLTGDSGSGATLGRNMATVAAFGPQAGYLFPIGDQQGYLNLRIYREFAAENRPAGWNMWLTFSVSPQGT